MGLSDAEKARRWRQRHPEQAAAHLAEIIGRPRRKKKPGRSVTVSTDEVITASGVDPESVAPPADMVVVTAPAEQAGEHLQAHASDPHTITPEVDLGTKLKALEDELAEIAEQLRHEADPKVCARLRLRADVASRRMIAAEKRARLPQPAAPDDWLKAYRQ